MIFYTDQFRTPTYAPHVARVVDKVAQTPAARGIFHVGGAERLSRYHFAQLLAERVGASQDLVRPGLMRDSGAIAARPADCSLVSQKLRRELGIAPTSCIDGLDELKREGYLHYLHTNHTKS
jgi:dTDP-4-dehydrorhamnose reductase